MGGAQAVARLAPQSATGLVLRRVARLLEDPAPGVVEPGARAVQALGPAATPAIIERLVPLLEDPYVGVRREAFRAVGAVGAAAANLEVLDRLGPALLGHGQLREQAQAPD